MFSEKELNLEEHQLREQIRRLSPAEKAIYDALEIPRLKLASTYVRLNWLFPLGVHHFYLRRWGRGLLDLFLTLNICLSLTRFSPWGDPNLLISAMMCLALLSIELPQMLNARLLVHSRNILMMTKCLQSARRRALRNQAGSSR
jgi:TM2 domain-containing membrane protein YozV